MVGERVDGGRSEHSRSATTTTRFDQRTDPLLRAPTDHRHVDLEDRQARSCQGSPDRHRRPSPSPSLDRVAPAAEHLRLTESPSARLQIFTQKKYEDLSPSTHNMDVPHVVRNEYQLVNIDEGFLNLLTQDGGEKNDVKVPEDKVGDEIQKAFDDGEDIIVTITSAMGEEHCLGWKPAPKS